MPKAIAAIIFMLSLLVGSSSVYATDEPKIDPAACRALVNYTPSADVDYKPGVDVHGHYVAPADLNSGPQVMLPKKIDIPLTVGLAKVLNFDTTKYPYNQLGTGTEAQLGVVSVEGNNVSFNGQPLSGDQDAKLAALCAKSGN